MAAVLDEAAQARHAQVEAVEAAQDAQRAHQASKPRPDAVVKEADHRRAIGRVVEGLAKQAQEVGMLPRAELARQWATGIVNEQVKKHEESFGKAQATPVTSSPSALDRGDVDGRVINRRVGTATLGAPGQGATANFAPRPQKPHDPLLKARMDMLLQMPEWNVKVMKAFEDGMAKYHDQSRAADDVMNVVEQSNRIFGDWRTPRKGPPDRLIIVGV